MERLPEEMIEVWRQGTRVEAYAGTLSSLMERLLRFRTPRPEYCLSDDEWRRIKQPVLFIWGDRDVIGRPTLAHRALRLLPAAKLDVIPGGHAPWFDDPAGCARSISCFLQDQGI
jgi:pimeloyl-ACP methyl ester carboxylesterase